MVVDCRGRSWFSLFARLSLLTAGAPEAGRRRGWGCSRLGWLGGVSGKAQLWWGEGRGRTAAALARRPARGRPAHISLAISSYQHSKAQQNRTEQNRQKLKNRKNIQEQTKPYLQNKQLILACGSRARQRLPDDGQKCDMESQVGHIAINRPDKAHQSLIYYARAHTHARSAKMTKNMAVLRSL